MNIEIPGPLAAEILRLANEADRAEGFTNRRPRDALTRLVDALRSHIQNAERENRIECEKIDEALEAFGDAYYELEDELRRYQEPLPWWPEAVAVAEEQAPPDDGKPMPF